MTNIMPDIVDMGILKEDIVKEDFVRLKNHKDFYRPTKCTDLKHNQRCACVISNNTMVELIS